MSDTNNKKRPAWMVDPDEQPVEITLKKSGCKAIIKPSTVETMQKAQRIADGDESKFTSVLMSLLVEIDGESYPPEDFKKMNMQDGLQIMEQISDENFSLALKT